MGAPAAPEVPTSNNQHPVSSLTQSFQNMGLTPPPQNNALGAPPSLAMPNQRPLVGQNPPFPASLMSRSGVPPSSFPGYAPGSRPRAGPPPSFSPGPAPMSRPGPPPSSSPGPAPEARPGPPPSSSPGLASVHRPGPPPSSSPRPAPVHRPRTPPSSSFGIAPGSRPGPTGPSPSSFPGATRPGPTPSSFPEPSHVSRPGPPPSSSPGAPPIIPRLGTPPGASLMPRPGPPPSSSHAGASPMHRPGPPASPFGESWRTPPRQLSASSMMTTMQPPLMYGVSSSALTSQAMNHPVGGSVASKVDPNQIPRPIPNSPVLLHETRQGNQTNPPPPATSDYIVKDTGNCSPRYMRCTIIQIPCTSDLLATSGMQLALLVQPFALPHPSEEPIQVVDFGEGGPLRCSRCKGYINPFMKFIDHGRRFICNLCGNTDETPREYQCNVGPDGRRRDADERPELCRGTVEFVASKNYMVRDPMPAVYFFLVDVSMNAIQTGAAAAACSAINQVLRDLPEGPRTMVGIATFDSTIHFYNLKRTFQQLQPLMLIVPDVQDVYTPLQTDVVVPLSECRQNLELLLQDIPTMFQSNMISDSVFGAAVKAAFLAMKSTGGKLLVFQSVLPSAGIGALSAREAEGRADISSADKEAHKLLQPADKTMKEMATEFAGYQVCVDVFLTTQSYIDVASISELPKITGGQMYWYYPFSAISDTPTLYNDLRWNVTRPQGFEAVMRLRCTNGIQVQEYSGNFCKHIPTDVDLPAIDCDKTIMVTLRHDDKLQDGSECAFQCALLYTTVYGERRIRVMNLSLSCTSTLANLFRSADLDTQFTCCLKQAASQIASTPLSQVREQVINHCVNILHSYRRFCSTVQSSGQLILPEALKLLPLYSLALVKSTGLRTDGRTDERSFWMTYVSSLSAPLAIPLIYPRLISVHDLCSKEMGDSLVPSALPLSGEHISDQGVYLLENAHNVWIYVGSSVDSNVLQQLFGCSSVAEIPTQFVLQQYQNPLSDKLNKVMNEIRLQRCSYLRLKLFKSGDSSEALFFTYMVEDKSPMGLSYVEFLVHIHRQIQGKMD